MAATTKRDTHLSEAGETSNNLSHVEVLRGRDGRDGRDGVPGPAGKDGRDGRDGKDGEVGETGKDDIRGPPGTPGPSSGGWSTLAGDEQPAPTHQEQSWSMQEGLEELIIIRQVEQPTTSACQRTQTIYSTRLECRATVQSMGLSMRQMEVL